VLVAFVSYLAQLVRPVSLIGRVVPMLAIAASSGERIFYILDALEDVKMPKDAVELQHIQGHVRL
jgi:ATP-binding cassette, subfamily B, multidrug efflux pump